MTDAIALEEVSFRYQEREVLAGLSLALRPGEIVAVLGPSGCGKTTLLRLILGFVAPERGLVRIAGEIASRQGAIVLPPEERALGVVFQDLALWPHLTVVQNLAFGLAAHGHGRAEREARIGAMLRRVALDGMEGRYPGELSGGERQRVAIARALVLEPRALLLDEPLANLDAALKSELLATFRVLLQERATTALYVTHDLREAARIGDRIAILERGRIAQQGILAELEAAPVSPFVGALLADLRFEGTRR